MRTLKLTEGFETVTLKTQDGKFKTFRAFHEGAEEEGKRFVNQLRKNASKSFVDGVVAELKKRKL